jgi:hypothetical protein
MKPGAAAAMLLATLISSGGSRPLDARVAAQSAPQADDDLAVRQLLRRLEQAALAAETSAYLSLVGHTADRQAASAFAETELRHGATRAVVQERDRRGLAGSLPGNGYRLTVDAFVEYGDRGRVATWQLDIRRMDDDWRIVAQSRVSFVENLYRLSLNPRKQFAARNFTIVAEDLVLTLAEGSVFVAETDQGVTALVLLGRGDMRFQPDSDTEKGQVRIFAGSDVIASRFDAAFVRVGTFAAHADPAALIPRDVDPRDLRRAQQLFREESVKSFAVDLADLAHDAWSLLPTADDFLAEIRTRQFDTLTYARSATEAEDISLFDRHRHRNIALYASKDRLAARGRFYNEDELAPFDVLDYDIAITMIPPRRWIDGRARMRLRVRAPSVGQLTIRLADTLVLRSVVSDQYGPLFALRVTNQNTILVNLPATLVQGTDMSITLEYAGLLEPQPSNHETMALAQRGEGALLPLADPFVHAESHYLYSNRAYWYPQSMVTDYATATIHITVPAAYSCVATGEQSADSPRIVTGGDAAAPRKLYMFTAERPLRYLGFIVSRLERADRWTVAFDRKETASPGGPRRAFDPTIAPYAKLDLIVDANPRQTNGRSVAERAVDIVQFYESLVGDSPYSAFTVALLDSDLPGGHSPGYFAVIDQPLPGSPVTWRNDPAAFSNYPEFFLAHEVAHQWWGGAVGWRNYHEQWLSEGFAQYFAALYADKFRGLTVFTGIMRQMRKWALEQSDQGPVYLGYRVGHIKGDGRAFRAIVYNKGAAVLHMLRRLIGDDSFFRGLRSFYTASRFTKVGTENLRAAMEEQSGRSLERFFERWIYSDGLPKVEFNYRVDSSNKTATLTFEQTGELFDIPVTATLRYLDRGAEDVLVPLSERRTELRVPLHGKLRSIEINKDDGSLVEVRKGRQIS